MSAHFDEKAYKIYFVVNFHGINHFLSLYNPDDNNIIIIGNNESMEEFARNYLQYDKLIILPALILQKRNIFSFPYSLLKIILKCRYFKKISSSSDVYFFNIYGSTEFCFAIKYLQKKGHKIFYNDPHKEIFFHEDLGTYKIDRKKKIYAALVNISCGLKLVWYKNRFLYGLGFNEKFNEISIDVITWKKIKEKLNFVSNIDTNKAVLIIDGPIQSYKNMLSLKESQYNLVCYFKKLLNTGKKIYLKPHYAMLEINSFSGTELEKSLYILPEYYPVELIMDEFEDIYFFASAASLSGNARKYSLLNLLQFHSKESKNKIIEVLKDATKDEYEKIVFVARD